MPAVLSAQTNKNKTHPVFLVQICSRHAHAYPAGAGAHAHVVWPVTTTTTTTTQMGQQTRRQMLILFCSSWLLIIIIAIIYTHINNIIYGDLYNNTYTCASVPLVCAPLWACNCCHCARFVCLHRTWHPAIPVVVTPCREFSFILSSEC